MRKQRRIARVERAAAENMTPEGWAIVLADDMAGHITLDDWILAQVQAATPQESVLLEPHYVYQRRTRRSSDSAAHQNAHFEYARRAALAMNVSLDLDSRLHEHQKNIEIRHLRFHALPTMMLDVTGNVTGVGRAEVIRDTVRQLWGDHLLSVVELTAVLSLGPAVELLSKEWFAGHVFLPSSLLCRLDDVECGYRMSIQHDFGALWPEDKRIDVERMALSPKSIRARAQAWKEQADQDARRQVSGTRRGSWPDLRRAVRAKLADRV